MNSLFEKGNVPFVINGLVECFHKTEDETTRQLIFNSILEYVSMVRMDISENKNTECINEIIKNINCMENRMYEIRDILSDESYLNSSSIRELKSKIYEIEGILNETILIKPRAE